MKYVFLIAVLIACLATVAGCESSTVVNNETTFPELIVKLERGGQPYSAGLFVHVDWASRPQEVQYIAQWHNFAQHHAPKSRGEFPIIVEGSPVYREHFAAACPKLPAVMVEKGGTHWGGEVIYKRSGSEIRVRELPKGLPERIFQRNRNSGNSGGCDCDNGQCNPAPQPAPTPDTEADAEKRFGRHHDKSGPPKPIIDSPWKEYQSAHHNGPPPAPNVNVGVTIPEKVTPPPEHETLREEETSGFSLVYWLSVLGIFAATSVIGVVIYLRS